MQSFQRGGDLQKFLSVCESVADEYSPTATVAKPGSDQAPTSALKKEDLRLLCFEFLS